MTSMTISCKTQLGSLEKGLEIHNWMDNILGVCILVFFIVSKTTKALSKPKKNAFNAVSHQLLLNVKRHNGQSANYSSTNSTTLFVKSLISDGQ